MKVLIRAGALLGLAACAPAASSGAGNGGGVVPPPPGAEAPAAPAPKPGGNEHGKAVVLKLPPYDRYLVERADTLTLQLPDGSTQTQAYRWSAWMDARASVETGGYHLVLTLDSLEVDAPGGMPGQPALDSARGTRWTAHLDPDGRLSSMETDRESSIASQFGAMLYYIYPPLPGNDVRSGATWTDSTTAPTRAQNFDVQETARMDYLVTGPAVHGDRAVLMISGHGTFTRTGSGLQYDQPMQYQADGQRQVNFYLSPDGTPAGMDGSEASKFVITVPAVGQSLNADQRGSFRISPTGES